MEQVFPVGEYRPAWGELEHARLRSGLALVAVAVVCSAVYFLLARLSHGGAGQTVALVAAICAGLSLVAAGIFGGLCTFWRAMSAKRFQRQLRATLYPLEKLIHPTIVDEVYDSSGSKLSVEPLNGRPQSVQFVAAIVRRIGFGRYDVEPGPDYHFVTDLGPEVLAVILGGVIRRD